MRILIIHCVYTNRGGEDTVVAEETKLMQAEGNMVQLLKFDNTNNQVLKLLQLPFNIPAYCRTIKEIDSFKPDVAHIHNLHFGASNSIIYAVKNRRIPLVITLHNFRLLCPSATLFLHGKIFTDSLNQNFCTTAIKKRAYQNSSVVTFWLSVSMWLHQKLHTWQLPDKFIVLSQHAKELFLHSKLKINETQLVVKPNFTEAPAITTAIRQGHFLFIGRLAEEKGIRLLLSVFSKLNVKIKIAGEGPYQAEVVAFSQKYPNIEYIGVLDKESIYKELQRCTALVFPSIWFEGMPLTIIEAFACGTAVIASKLGAMAAMVKNESNGLHFDPYDEIDVAAKIGMWASLNEEEKLRYRTNAYNSYVQNYTPQKNTGQLLAIYNDAIAQKQPLAFST